MSVGTDFPLLTVLDWLDNSWKVDHDPLSEHPVYIRLDITEADLCEYNSAATALFMRSDYANMVGECTADQIAERLAKYSGAQVHVDRVLTLIAIAHMSENPEAEDLAATLPPIHEIAAAVAARGLDPRSLLFFPDLAPPEGCVMLARMLAARSDLLPGGPDATATYFLKTAGAVGEAVANFLPRYRIRGPEGAAFRHRHANSRPKADAEARGDTSWSRLVTAAAHLGDVPGEVLEAIERRHRPTAVNYRDQRRARQMRAELQDPAPTAAPGPML